MKHIFSLTTLFVLLLLTSCTKEVLPCFEPESGNNTVDVGTSVKFNNCSLFAEEMEWDFGDGTTATDRSPSHPYQASGTYIVTLKAFSKGRKKSGTVADVITVGTRIIDRVRVNSIPAVDSLGNAWDPSDSADLVFKFGPSSAAPTSWIIESNEATNATFPHEWTFTSGTLTNVDWTWLLLEADGGNSTTIAQGTLNPLSVGTEGNITLQLGGTSITVHYNLD